MASLASLLEESKGFDDLEEAIAGRGQTCYNVKPLAQERLIKVSQTIAEAASLREVA